MMAAVLNVLLNTWAQPCSFTVVWQLIFLPGLLHKASVLRL